MLGMTESDSGMLIFTFVLFILIIGTFSELLVQKHVVNIITNKTKVRKDFLVFAKKKIINNKLLIILYLVVFFLTLFEFYFSAEKQNRERNMIIFSFIQILAAVIFSIFSNYYKNRLPLKLTLKNHYILSLQYLYFLYTKNTNLQKKLYLNYLSLIYALTSKYLLITGSICLLIFCTIPIICNL